MKLNYTEAWNFIVEERNKFFNEKEDVVQKRWESYFAETWYLRFRKIKPYSGCNKIKEFDIDPFDLRKLYYETNGIEVIKGLRITGYSCHKYNTNILIKYNGHEYLIIDTAHYRYLYLF